MSSQVKTYQINPISHYFNIRFLSLGVADTIKKLRTKYGIKIGSSTGYTSEIMAKLKVCTTRNTH